MEHDQLLLDAIECARLAGKIQLQHFRTANLNATAKLNDSDIVTVADKLSEAAIIGYVHEHYPEHSILSEESGSERRKSEYEWVIDPVDGTTNYTVVNHEFATPFQWNFLGIADVHLEFLAVETVGVGLWHAFGVRFDN